MKFNLVGAGRLGKKVLRRLLKNGAQVSKVWTATERTHEELRQLGVEPEVLEPDRLGGHDPGTGLIYCVPPFEGAVDQVSRLVSSISGSPLVYISATSVYTENSGGVVNETSTINESHLLTLLERLFLERGGTVLRLVGLYDYEKGPQKVYLRHDSLKSSPEGLVNLVHYNQAADAIVETALGGEVGVFNVSDEKPLTRQMLAQTAFDLYSRDGVSGIKVPQFTGHGVDGKVVVSERKRWGFSGFGSNLLSREL